MRADARAGADRVPCPRLQGGKQDGGERDGGHPFREGARDRRLPPSDAAPRLHFCRSGTCTRNSECLKAKLGLLRAAVRCHHVQPLLPRFASHHGRKVIFHLPRRIQGARRRRRAGQRHAVPLCPLPFLTLYAPSPSPALSHHHPRPHQVHISCLYWGGRGSCSRPHLPFPT